MWRMSITLHPTHASHGCLIPWRLRMHIATQDASLLHCGCIVEASRDSLAWMLFGKMRVNPHILHACEWCGWILTSFACKYACLDTRCMHPVDTRMDLMDARSVDTFCGHRIRDTPSSHTVTAQLWPCFVLVTSASDTLEIQSCIAKRFQICSSRLESPLQRNCNIPPFWILRLTTKVQTCSGKMHVGSDC